MGKWLPRIIIAVSLAGIVGLGVLDLLSIDSHVEPRRRSACRERLKQIGLALHQYYDDFGCFPPPFLVDDAGQPSHSWRVLLLPYLNLEDVYQQYRFDEPWNGPNNRALAAREPRIGSLFSCPGVGASAETSGHTSYVAVIGPNTMWQPGRGIAADDVTDGLTRTIMVAEVVNSGIHWMEPRDLHVSQMAPRVNPRAAQGISSSHEGRAHMLYGDGAVRYLLDATPEETIRGLLTIDGGELDAPIDD